MRCSSDIFRKIAEFAPNRGKIYVSCIIYSNMYRRKLQYKIHSIFYIINAGKPRISARPPCTVRNRYFLVFLHNVFCFEKYDFSYIPLDKSSNLCYNYRVKIGDDEESNTEAMPQRAAAGEKRRKALCEKHFGACEGKRENVSRIARPCRVKAANEWTARSIWVVSRKMSFVPYVGEGLFCFSSQRQIL